MLQKTKFLFILVCSAALCCAGCQTVHDQKPVEKDGKYYGVLDGGAFPYKWYDFYEQALSYADGNFWKEAELDLKEAIRQRDGDQKQARTYARNFIEYFPHRELGIIYYKQGRFEESLKELRISLDAEKSPEAEHYFELARKSFAPSAAVISSEFPLK
ncbi:MAG: hypothetical protein BWK80_50085 [Desulfobacteraceae bacterium IS3]|nr:MAG: hypothetical protein BWK80_50085 [Desulfobacteraceae bacterium IS3]